MNNTRQFEWQWIGPAWVLAVLSLGVALAHPTRAFALPIYCNPLSAGRCTTVLVSPYTFRPISCNSGAVTPDTATAAAKVISDDYSGMCQVTNVQVGYVAGTPVGNQDCYSGETSYLVNSYGVETSNKATYSLTYGQPSGQTCQNIRTYSWLEVLRERGIYCPKGYSWQGAYCWGNQIDLTKNFGVCKSCSLMQGNPVNVAIGNKVQVETDYVGTGPQPLVFKRTYNSLMQLKDRDNSYFASSTYFDYYGNDISYSKGEVGNSDFMVNGTNIMGAGWRHTYQRAIVFRDNDVAGGVATAFVYRDDGKVLAFTLYGGQFIADYDVSDQLALAPVGSGAYYQYTVAATEDVEYYSAAGRLLSIRSRSGETQTLAYDPCGRLSTVTDSFGRSLVLGYGGSPLGTPPDCTSALTHLATLQDPAGQIYTYGSNGSHLTSVTYPDGTSRQYGYADPNWSNALTSITDENNVQFASFSYDAIYGKVTQSQHVGGVDRISLSYPFGTVVTDALGTARTFSFTYLNGTAYSTGVDQTCTGCGPIALSEAQDANGNTVTRTDFKNVPTTYVYDLTRNLETSRTEASGTPRARTITTTWHTIYRLPLSISIYASGTATGTPLRTTSFTYDTAGNALTKTVTDPATGTSRTWAYTYNPFGKVLTADGPRTDVVDKTTYTYYSCTTGFQCGQLQTVTDALSHVTTYNTYNAHGQPLTITDPNNVVTTLTYDLRQRLKSRQVGTETTSFDYWPIGLLKKVTLPDSSTIQYTYDAAHRLRNIADSLGNHFDYTLDAMGNRTAESAYDPASTLHRTHTRVYNSLNQLYQDLNAAGTAAVTTTFGYDPNGNPTTTAAPLARNSTNTYDELNRLNQITDPGSGITQFGYDANDNLLSVRDPRNLTTSYVYNGFGDVKTQTSPDTGTTTNIYDSGGNLATSTDARNAISTYTYDAVNRVATIAYIIGTTTDQTLTFTYDTNTNGVGRLRTAADANHSTSWTYDAQGRVIGKGQTLGTVTKSVGYAYTNGNLTTLTTPSGQSVTYGYSANHQVVGVAVNGTTLLSNATYEPFGAVKGWTWGNATTSTRTYDTDGRISQIANVETSNFGYDYASRATTLNNATNSLLNWTYGYDLLDRLNSAAQNGTTYGWTYDADGNRLTQTGTFPQTLTPSTTSNRLASAIGRTYTYDTAGNTLNYGTNTFTYYNRGRMKTAKVGTSTTTYVLNALGQRIKKSGGAAGTVLYMYDEAGHLLGEYTSTGGLVQETVWLGDIPVATIRPGTPVAIYYVHADHLNTPKIVTRPSDNKQAWRWDQNPYGLPGPAQNPQSLGTFVYNLRFPGQYYDQENGQYYNYFRDFDPQVGRYVESDPIGLRGGVNTYAYVRNLPTQAADPLGLVAWNGSATSISLVSGIGATFTRFSLESECACGKKVSVNILAVGPSIGLGLKVTGGASPASFNDPWQCPDANSLEGLFLTGAAGLSFGAIPNPNNPRIGTGLPGLGSGVSYTQMGDAISIGWPPGYTVGRDKSISATLGSATVTSSKVTSCCGK